MKAPHNAFAALDYAIEEVTKARNLVLSKSSKQVSSAEERDYLKSVVYAWIKTHRESVLPSVSKEEIRPVDAAYDQILQSTANRAARTTYGKGLREVKTGLVELRSVLVNSHGEDPSELSGETAPDFAPLAADQQMREILKGRWQECQKCIRAEAHLAATVMMGGLLEALFVARANKLPDKSALFKAKSAPVDGRTKKPLQLKEWTLRPFIDVGHELSWITKSGKEVAEVLRDYRNYVHPEKERSHGITLGKEDSAMFWEITKLIARQLLVAR